MLFINAQNKLIYIDKVLYNEEDSAKTFISDGEGKRHDRQH